LPLVRVRPRRQRTLPHFQIPWSPLHVKATKGFESAEVCAGGVDVRELEAKNLMSKTIANLYFCGEVLDIDGDCGGFNLHFAWASGYLVGQSL